jgi:hypothetical protein
LILGLPYFGRIAERALRDRGWEATYAAHPGRSPAGWAALAPALARTDLLYLISSRIDRRSPQALLARAWRKPIVIHWVGTDVLFALDEYRAGTHSERLLRGATHIADAPWLIGELAEMGVTADYLALPVPGLEQGLPPPLPPDFTVLLYLPVDPVDREVFELDAILALPRAFPAARFILLPSPARTLPGALPPNLECRGWVEDMEALYREVTAFVRLTLHDGTSFMAIEALSRGRYVIWTMPFNGAIRADGFEQTAAALAGLLELSDTGRLAVNTAGREAVLGEFDPTRLGDELDACLRAALEAGRAPQPHR